MVSLVVFASVQRPSTKTRPTYAFLSKRAQRPSTSNSSRPSAPITTLISSRSQMQSSSVCTQSHCHCRLAAHNFLRPSPIGSWAGLCKIDKEGNARKIVGCTCVVVKDYGVDSEGMHVLLDYFRTRA